MNNKPVKSRAMDGMYRTDNEVLDVLSSMLGLTLGDAENGIWYIQDAGYKKINHCFIDKNNKKLYRCKVNTSSTSNTIDNFEELNLFNHSDRLDNFSNFFEDSNFTNKTGRFSSFCKLFKEHESFEVPVGKYMIVAQNGGSSFYSCVSFLIVTTWHNNEDSQQLELPNLIGHTKSLFKFDMKTSTILNDTNGHRYVWFISI